MTTAWLEYVGSSVRCRIPYHRTFVTALKRSVPPACRSWDPVERVWWVDLPYTGVVEELCWEFFDEVRSVGPSTPRPPVPDHYQALYVTPNAPDEVVAAAYRVLVLKWHPDRCRDVSASHRMKAINATYDRVTRERRARSENSRRTA